MAITLGKDSTSTAPHGAGIITASYTEEVELIDITNRDNMGGAAGAPGYKISETGFTTKTWEIECHDVTAAMTALTSAPTAGAFTVMSVAENRAVDGAVTFTITAKEA